MKCIRFMNLKKLKQKDPAYDTLNDLHSHKLCGHRLELSSSL